MIERTASGPRQVALLLLVVTAVLPAAPPAGAAPIVAVEPPGTITVIEQAGWSWFEDARATFSPDGSSLFASAVAGSSSTDSPPGTVVLSEVALSDGDRELVDLGRAEPDDHNSASIDASGSGEVHTAWSRHQKDRNVRQQRRRTDGSWLRLPPQDVGSLTTYNNLRRAADAEGNPILYDFVRGPRLDPVALASADEGRTWQRLGPVVRDPGDDPSQRPYVQYSESRDGRIDLIATEGHPGTRPTSIYHGYLEDGLLHDSTGLALGPIGSGVSVTSLTRVWEASAAARAWTNDLEIDPVTGHPVVSFSVTHHIDDHRYWMGRWDGDSWEAEEIAFAGRGLYLAEPHYTGLSSIDPVDTDRVVVSTDAHPDTGAPLISSTDGQRHWELWQGLRQGGSGWTWAPLTSGSTTDHLRPVLIAHPSGASAMLWLRGEYSTYVSYATDVVAVVTRPNATTVPSGDAAWVPTTDVLPAPAPLKTAGRPAVGAFDGHAADDLLLPRTGSARDDLYLGDDHRHPTPITARSVATGAQPIAGDFDGNGRTDIYWYAPGSATDRLWTTSGTAVMTDRSTRQVTGTYIPVPGDFDGDGDTDLLWYAPGATTDHLWRATPTGFTSAPSPIQVSGSYRPIAGDFTGDGRTDVYWYAPGSATDHLWKARPGGGFSSGPASRQVAGTFTPVPGDFDGNGRTDVLWYAPGSATDYLWTTTASGFSSTLAPQPVSGTYTPIAGDHDGDGADDVHWYSPGPATDYLWWSADGPLADSEAAAADL